MFAKTVISLGLATIASASAFSISTPEQLTQCAPAKFTWTPSAPPYYLSITDSDTYPTFSSSDEIHIIVPRRNTATWLVDLPAGRNVTVTVRDQTGEIAETWPRVIGEGSDECLDEFVLQ